MNAQKFDLSGSEEDGSSSASETDASDSSPVVSILPSIHVSERGIATDVHMKRPIPKEIHHKKLTREGNYSTGYTHSSGELIGVTMHCGSDDLYRIHGMAPVPPPATTILAHAVDLFL